MNTREKIEDFIRKYEHTFFHVVYPNGRRILSSLDSVVWDSEREDSANLMLTSNQGVNTLRFESSLEFDFSYPNQGLFNNTYKDQAMRFVRFPYRQSRRAVCDRTCSIYQLYLCSKRYSHTQPVRLNTLECAFTDWMPKSLNEALDKLKECESVAIDKKFGLCLNITKSDKPLLFTENSVFIGEYAGNNTFMLHEPTLKTELTNMLRKFPETIEVTCV